MANEDPSRTEWPTARRIFKARDEGNVLMSQDISSFVVLFSGTLLLFITLPWLADAFRGVFELVLQIDCRGKWTDTQIFNSALAGLALVGRIIAPACLGVCLASILETRLQIGTYFSTQTLHWKFDSLWNFKGAMKELLPNKESLVNFGLTFCKVTLVGYLIYTTISSEINELMELNLLPLWSGIKWGMSQSVILIIKILVTYLVIVAVSYWNTRKKYYDNLMMTKQEVKDEYKDMDGDPRIKAKIRAKMREIFFRSMAGNMKNADLVVTNPTHVAVALKYDPAKDAAPSVIAKGLRKRAEKIKELARLHAVPMVEAPPLARSLYRSVKIGKIIPSEFYRPVAAILAKLHKSGKLKRKSVLDKKK